MVSELRIAKIKQLEESRRRFPLTWNGLVDFRKEDKKVLNWDKKDEKDRPVSLLLQTNTSEVLEGARFLNELRTFGEYQLRDMSGDDFDHFLSKWRQEDGNPVRFMNHLNLRDQSLVARYVQPETPFEYIYRARNFFKTVECRFTTHMSEEVLGAKVDFPGSKCGVEFWESLTEEQQGKLIEWSNKLHV